MSIENLKELAEAATPGPWFAADWTQDDGPQRWTVEAHAPEVCLPGQGSIWPGGVQKLRVAETEYGHKPTEDAAFIAAANPQNVLALIARAEAAEAALSACQAEKEIACRVARACMDALNDIRRTIHVSGRALHMDYFGALARIADEMVALSATIASDRPTPEEVNAAADRLAAYVAGKGGMA